MMSEGEQASQAPSIIALLLADAVYVDARSKRTTIAGAFNTLTFSKLPERVNRPLTVFVSMIDPRGIVDFHVVLERAETGEKLFDVGGPLRTPKPNPHAVMDMHLEIGRLEFKEPGLYWLQVIADHEILNQRPLRVRLKPDGSGDQVDL